MCNVHIKTVNHRGSGGEMMKNIKLTAKIGDYK